MRRNRSANIAAAVDNLIGGMEASSRVRESLALAYWDKIVGRQAAAATEAESVKEGVLFVRTKSSVWSHELTFLKSVIISKLNQRLGRPLIREIIFRAQGVKKPPIPEPISKPTDEELAAVILTPADQKQIDSELRKLRSIGDDTLRQTVSCRLIRERRMDRWRLDHGWTSCSHCGSIHPLAGPLCPLCAISV